MAQQMIDSPPTQCYLCWKDYKNPQKLTCGHMFCCQCLHNVIVSLAQQSINIKVNCVLECPICYLPTENINQAFQIGSATMKDFPLTTKETVCSVESQKGVLVPIAKQKINVDDWFGTSDSKNAVKLSGINVEMCFQAYESRTKYERLPIGWTLSSQEGGAIQVPRKLYRDFSRSFFSQQDVNSCDGTNGIEYTDGNHLGNENDLREQQFLNSLELAEIQFLQPDSIRGDSYYKNRYEEKMNSKTNQNGNSVKNRDFTHPNGELDTLIGTTDSPNLNPLQARKMHRKTSEDNLIAESQNITNSKNINNSLNGGICIQNSKYKEINPISSAILNKNSRYSKKNVRFASTKILTSGRHQISGKRLPISTCKFHSEEIASLYCTSCQMQTCNVCFFDRHQHCTIQMSKEATCSLSRYLHEKLLQAKMMKAQLESWVSKFEGELNLVSQQAEEILIYMREMLKEKRKMIIGEIEKIRESSSVRKIQESFSECTELEDRLTAYLQELRWLSSDNCLVHPFLQSNVPSLHMPTSAELNNICLLRPVLQPNAFVVRTFLEMQNHSLGNVQLQCPYDITGSEIKIATGSHLAGQNLSHKMENILEKCLPSLPLKLCVFGTIKGDEVAQHDSVDSIILLPNRCTLLSDPSNLKVKLLSFQGQRLGEVSFESRPNGLCLWKPSVAAVTVSNLKKIYFLNCENILSVHSAVSTKRGYWGLAAGDIECVPCLLGAASHSSSVDILKYDQSLCSFIILKVISPPKLEMWGIVCNLSFTKNSCIIVADCFGSRVLCINLEGKVLFEFPGQKDGLLKCPADVTADEQYIYVSDIGNNRILRLGHYGAFNGVILTAQDGLLRPKAIDIDEFGHLAISQFTEWPALLIFKTRF